MLPFLLRSLRDLGGLEGDYLTCRCNIQNFLSIPKNNCYKPCSIVPGVILELEPLIDMLFLSRLKTVKLAKQ